MGLFLDRDERIRYLGFDDRRAVLIGVPTVSLLSFILFTAGVEVRSWWDSVGCIVLGTAFTFTYWVINRGAVIVLRRRFPSQRETPLRVILMVLVAAASVLFMDWGVNSVLLTLIPDLLPSYWGNNAGLFSFAASLMLCAMVLGAYEAVYFFAKYRQSLLEQERLARVNMQAQLAALKQQVNPHFLFNSLNTLTNLIPEDAGKAVTFTQRLSAVYRRILEYRHQELISLEEELDALRDYVFLMQTRFEDKLRVEWELGDASSGGGAPNLSQVPSTIVPLSLQLLVENAIKHNVVSADHPLVLHIRVRDEEITVTNSLNPRNRSVHSTGWGHDSIRHRYRMVTDRPVTVQRTATRYRVSLPLIPVDTPRYATA